MAKIHSVHPDTDNLLNGSGSQLDLRKVTQSKNRNSNRYEM